MRAFIAGIWTNAFGTLLSRAIGLARDIATAALLGLGDSGVMDAFVIAVRVPNLFRRLLGEGALASSFLPVFLEEHESSPQRAWQLLSALLAWLSIGVFGMVCAIEGVLLVAWLFAPDSPGVRLLVACLAANLPYVLTVCVMALIGAALQAHNKFLAPALAPVLLNVCWLAGAWWIAPAVSSDKQTQAFVLIGCIQIGGVMQVLVQLPALRALGFRWDYDLREIGGTLWKVLRGVATVSFGLAITQINTLFDSLLAWWLSVGEGPAATAILAPGAAAAIYYGERFYQFPLGVLGIAIATAIFPLLSRHAAKGDRQQLGDDLSLGIGVTLFASVPAAAGLVLLAEPLARATYQHGAFNAEDAARTARMIAIYSSAVWAFCLLPVVTRGFYALGDQRTPVRIGLAAMLLNLSLDLSLVWSLAEFGLAASTAVAAIVQVALLLGIFARREGTIRWEILGRSLIRTIVATSAMAIVVATLSGIAPNHPLVELAVRVFAGIAAFLAAARILSAPELRMLAGRK